MHCHCNWRFTLLAIQMLTYYARLHCCTVDIGCLRARMYGLSEQIFALVTGFDHGKPINWREPRFGFPTNAP